MDKTNLLNLLTIIATVILGGGDLVGVDWGTVPEWAIPIIALVAIAINIASREMVKREAMIGVRMYESVQKRIDDLLKRHGEIKDAK